MLTLADYNQLKRQQEKYAFEPWKWCSEVINFKPRTWQEEAFHNLIEHKYLAMSTGTGPGKTAFLAATILWFMLTRPFPRIPCTAPNQTRLFDNLWPEIAKWRRQSPLCTRFLKQTKTGLYLVGHEEEWYAVARTSRIQPGEGSTEGLHGYHADHLLAVVDEASGIPDQVMSALDGASTTKDVMMIIAGNPIRRTGYFFRVITDERLHVENGGTWKFMQINCEDVPEVNRVHMRRAIEFYGKDSDYYRTKVLGLPPRQDSQSLISPEQVYESHMREGDDRGFCVLSCDPARYGNDDTVLYLREGKVFRKRWQLSSKDTATVANFIIELDQLHNPEYIVVDDIGVGAGVVDRVREQLKEFKGKCIGVNVGSQASRPERFYNLRTEIFWNLQHWIDEVSIPLETDKLDEELTNLRYGWNSKDSRIQLESKDQIKKLIGRSPNDADAFALNLYVEFMHNQRDVRGFFVKKDKIPAKGASWIGHNPNNNRRIPFASFGHGAVGARSLRDLNRKNW